MEQTSSLLNKEQINSMTNLASTSGLTNLLTDLGAALVFGVGFYFFKSHFKKGGEDKDVKDKMKPLKEKIEECLNKWENSLSLQKINTLIKKEFNDHNFDPFAVLDQLQKSSINPDISIINTLLDTTSRFKDYKNFNRLCELICSEEGISYNLPQPNIVTYNIILKGISSTISLADGVEEKNKKISKVDKIMCHMDSISIKPNDITLNTIIDIMVESGNYNLAWKYYDEMESLYGVQPDIYTYSTLLKSIKNHEPDQKNIDRAFNILRIIKLSKSKGIKPDEILYNCILDTCVKYHKIKQAEILFNDMKEANIKPSKITYAIMIKAYGVEHNFEKSLEIFKEMKSNGHLPNDIIYGCLLNAAVKSGKLEKAIEIHDEIKNSEVQMNIILYTTLIKGYTKVKNSTKAIELYEKMIKDSNLIVNTIAYNAILDCCVECNNLIMLNKIYNDFKSRAEEDETNAQPDLITYSTVIKAYCKQKNIDKVEDIFNYIQGRKDFILDEVIYNIMLDGMLKAEKYEQALKIYENMITNGIKKSNATYSILIKIYSKLGSVEKAVKVYNEMLESGIKPSLITYTSIIQILIKSKKIENAVTIFEEVLNNKLAPDQVMFNVIINGCIFNGKLIEACKFIKISFNLNIKLCEDIYKNIMCNLLTNRQIDFKVKIQNSLQICNEMKNRGYKIDYELYYKVMRMIYKSYGKKCEFYAQQETNSYVDNIEGLSKFNTNKNSNCYNNKENISIYEIKKPEFKSSSIYDIQQINSKSFKNNHY